MARRLRSLLIVVGGVALVGCRAPTEITLDLSTDIPCSELLGTAITVGEAPIEQLDPATVTRQCSGDGTIRTIGTIVATPDANGDADVSIRVVAGVNVEPEECVAPAYKPASASMTAGCVVARRRLNFQDHDPLDLPIVLHSDCLNNPCEATQTCLDGSCIDAQIQNSQQCATVGACGDNVLGDAGPPTMTATPPPLHTVAAGDDAACAIGSDGKVYCWGDQSAVGPLGANDPVLTPTAAMTVTASSISTNDHVCAIAAKTKALYCWGAYFEDGTSGDGVSAPFPNPIPEAGEVDEVVTPAQTTCVRSGGKVSCFGDPSVGFAGVVSSAVVQPLTQVADIDDATALSVGNNGVCAVRPGTNGAARATCWSDSVPIPHDVPGLTDVKQITHAGGWVLVLRNDGSVVGSPATNGVWGPLQSIKLPAVDAILGGGLLCVIESANKSVVCADLNKVSLPAPVWYTVTGFPANDQVVELSSGNSHTSSVDTECARMKSGKVYCWGANDDAQLGIGFPGGETTPTPIPNVTAASTVTASRYGTTIVFTDGTVRELGGARIYGHDTVTTGVSLVPTPIPGNFTSVTRVRIEPYELYGYLLQSNGALGVLNGGTRASAFDLQASPDVATITDVQIFAGPYVDMGVYRTGLAFYTAEPNAAAMSGLLANGGKQTGAYSDVSLQSPKGIAAGKFHGLAWNGTLYCWGSNASPACGVSSPATITTPTAMPLAGETVATACAGEDHTCAVTASGKLYCWGSSEYGLGGVHDKEWEPEQKASGASFPQPWIGVACADYQTCAWSSTQVACWGQNDYGQLGIGNFATATTPALVKGLVATDVSLSGDHACAVTADGGVSCWGNGFTGKLGNGQSGYYLGPIAPTPVP